MKKGESWTCILHKACICCINNITIDTGCKDAGCKEHSASLDYGTPCQNRKQAMVYHSVKPHEAILFSRYANDLVQGSLTAPVTLWENQFCISFSISDQYMSFFQVPLNHLGRYWWSFPPWEVCERKIHLVGTLTKSLIEKYILKAFAGAGFELKALELGTWLSW